MSYQLPDIRTADVSGKTVFLRADLDVPLADGVIEDDARLVAGFPTIDYLLKNGARVIVAGHLDRPKGKNLQFSLKPAAAWFKEKLKVESGELKVTRLDGFDGWEITPNLFLLENLRFYQGEEENDPEFTKKLANLADLYVNDAFAMCHRSHASVVGVAKILPHFAGFRLQEELGVLSSLLENPTRPLVVVIGGKKVETKLPLVSKMLSFADKVLVGGLVGQELRENAENLIVAKLNDAGTDILEESLRQFTKIIKTAKTIVWNGPVGRIQNSEFIIHNSERGTRELAKAIAESSAYKVVGGGDTTEFLKRIGLLDKFDFVSTGGGAMLAFLSGEKLPGLEVLVH